MRRSDACRYADVEPIRRGVCNALSMAAVATSVIGAFAANVIGQMMAPEQPQGGGAGPAPEVPAALSSVADVKTPKPMPVAPQPGGISKAKAERSLAQQMSMTRASTILSDDNSKLG